MTSVPVLLRGWLDVCGEDGEAEIFIQQLTFKATHLELPLNMVVVPCLQHLSQEFRKNFSETTMTNINE